MAMSKAIIYYNSSKKTTLSISWIHVVCNLDSYKCSSNHKQQQSLSDISNDPNRKKCYLFIPLRKLYSTKKVCYTTSIDWQGLMLTNQNCEVNISKKRLNPKISPPSDRVISI